MELPLFALGWAEIQGPDAQDFLHRLSTVPVQSLVIGAGKRGFFLSGLGKIQSFFTLWKLAEDRFGFEFPLGQTQQWKTALEQSIEKSHFSEKFTFQFRSDQCVWLFTQKDLDHRPFYLLPSTKGAIVTYQGRHPFGHPWYVLWNFSDNPTSLPQDLEKNQIQLSPERLEYERIASLYPHPDREMSVERIPLELGFKEAFEEAKGCFPGHEVTERLLRTLATPRRLALLEWEGACAVGDDVFFVEKSLRQSVASLTSCSPQWSAENSPLRKNSVALSLIPRMHAQIGKEVYLSNGAPGRIKALA